MTIKDQLHQELEVIRVDHDGVIRASDVLDWARQNPDSALHQQFEWADTVAAEKFRLSQARSIIRLVVTVPHREAVRSRAYVSLPQDRMNTGGGYRAIRDVMSNEELRAQLLQQALNELASFRRKYADLSELSILFAQADKLIADDTKAASA